MNVVLKKSDWDLLLIDIVRDRLSPDVYSKPLSVAVDAIFFPLRGVFVPVVTEAIGSVKGMENTV